MAEIELGLLGCLLGFMIAIIIFLLYTIFWDS